MGVAREQFSFLFVFFFVFFFLLERQLFLALPLCFCLLVGRGLKVGYECCQICGRCFSFTLSFLFFSVVLNKKVTIEGRG